MKLRHLMLALMLAAGLAGCSSYSIDSRHTYDSRTDFSGINSYAWAPEDEAIFSTPDSGEHFRTTMEDALAAKGFKLDPASPDFLISTRVVESYVEKYRTTHGYAEFPKEMLRINFLDPSSNEAIYESAAYAYMSGDEKQEAKNAIIDKAVEALLSEFPPGR